MYMPAASVTATVPSAVAAPIPATTVAPSYGAAPQAVVPAPVSLTAGMIEPATLQAEGVAYEKALAAQLAKQSQAVMDEAEIKKKMLKQTADAQIKQMELQLNEQLTMACLRVDQETANTVTGLKEAAIMQQTGQEERTAVAIADYNKKKAIEDMAVKSAQLQKQWYDGEAQLMAQYQSVMRAGSKSVITPGAPQVPVGMIQ